MTMTRTAEIRPVRISDMRVPRAGAAQRPFNKAHGDRLAAELDLEKLGYPVINLAGGAAWILDGQHRIHALRQRGFGDELLDCEVYEGLTEAEMAERFLGRNSGRAVSAYERFQVAVTAGRARESAIDRLVTSLGLKVSNAGQRGCVQATAVLLRVEGRYGASVLAQALRTIRDAYDADPGAFGRGVVEGLGLLYVRYQDNVEEPQLVARLRRRPNGVYGLLHRAADYRQRLGRPQPQCVAAAATEIYNQGQRGKARLPDWWRETPPREAS